MALPSSRQLPLDLGHRASSGRDDFLVGDCNRDAVHWIDLWPDWPAPALILHGPASCGKSHLAAIWAERTAAAFVPVDRLTMREPRELLDASAHLIIDGLDSAIGDIAAETALFHLYNVCREEGRNLLITLRTPPVRQAFALPDLASRLRAAPSAAIQSPDDTLLAALLVKLFADRQLHVGEDVIQYILPRMERSFAAARDIVIQADATALDEKRNISVPLLRGILMTGETGQKTK